MTDNLKTMHSSLSTAVERRLFAEYGAVFVTNATPPPKVIFSGPAEVEAFQSSLAVSRRLIGDFEVSLQTGAMEALAAARSSLVEAGGQLSARAADSGGRSYEDTVRLWTRNVARGLDHWVTEGLLAAERASEIGVLAPADQVAVILEMEERDALFFGTYFDKSILYSVAAPGASQHLSLLAFDVSEYEEVAVERSMNDYGWFRTVPNDLPHFTYLGCGREALPDLGLRLLEKDYGNRRYGFWVADLKRLDH